MQHPLVLSRRIAPSRRTRCQALRFMHAERLGRHTTTSRGRREMSDALPLADIRVVEFTHAVMGPTCGMFLNDLGAEVVKVEPAPEGDRTRYLKAAGAGYFAYYNRGKKSLAVDLESAEGRA